MRVKIARQSWGTVVDPAGNVQTGLAVTITHTDGETPATVFAGMTGETTVTPTTNVRGEIAGWITAGEYLLTVGDLEDERVVATHGRVFIPETGGGEGVDALPAFEQAVSRAALEEYGGTVELQVGLFEYRSYNVLTGRPTVFVPANVHVVGPGADLCTIRQHMDSPENLGGSAFRVEPAGYDPDVPLEDGDFVRNVRFSGFTYDGNQDDVVRGNGLVATGMADFLIQDVRLKNCWNSGLSMSSCKDGHISHMWLKEIGSKENAEFAGVDTSACHGIVTTRANITQPWCENITFSHIIADDVQHSAMRLSSIRNSTVTGLTATREPESPFFFTTLTQDLEPADTVAHLASTTGAWFPNGSIITIGTDRFEFDTTTGLTLTGVATEDVNEVPRSATYPASTEVRIGRTSGYGGLRFSNSAHGVEASAIKIKGYRRGIHWAGTAYECHVVGAHLEDCGYQAALMNGHDNSLIGFTVKNCCVYAAEASGDEEEDNAAVDSTAIRLANAERNTIIGSIVDDGLDENGDPRDLYHDYGLRETGGDYNRIDVRVEGFNLAALHSDGINNDLTGSRDNGSNEIVTSRYLPLPYGQKYMTVTASTPSPIFAINGETTGASLNGAVLSGVDTITIDRSLGEMEPGQTIIVGTGVDGETAVIESVDGLELTLTTGLANDHADEEGVYPFRWPIGHEITLRFTGTPTLTPSDVLRLVGDEPFTPESADDRITLIGDYDGMGLREKGGRGALYASEEDLTSHVDDSALDGGPHNLPALTNNGEAWVRQAGALTAVDVATQAELDLLLSTYRNVHRSPGQRANATSITGAGVFVFGASLAWGAASNAAAGNAAFPFDPAEFAITGKTLMCRIQVLALVNDTAPGVSATFGLYPVTAVAGANSTTVSTTLGTVVTGSTVAMTTPAANATPQLASADFAAPAAGEYIFGADWSGSPAANSAVVTVVTLQVTYD